MTALATATCFVWLGMVLAISFLEAPLKFRAPGVDLRIGLAIGRVVFRALNIAEVALAAVLLSCVLGALRPALGPAVASVSILAVQLVAVRPRLTRRSSQVLAGLDSPRSHGHLVYVALEVAKVVALVITGILLLTAT